MIGLDDPRCAKGAYIYEKPGTEGRRSGLYRVIRVEKKGLDLLMARVVVECCGNAGSTWHVELREWVYSSRRLTVKEIGAGYALALAAPTKRREPVAA